MWTLAPTLDPTHCYRCRGSIDPGTVTFSVVLGRLEYWGDNSTIHYHPACMIDVRAESALEQLLASPLRFAERDALIELASGRALHIRAAKLGPKAREKLGPLPPVAFARDPLGRPRVRALLVGNAAQAHPLVPSDAPRGFSVSPSLAELIRDQTVRSPRREYVFVPQGKSPNLHIDPSQPIVAGVLMMHAIGTPAPAYRSRIGDWLALSLPAPVLVVLGHTAAAREAYVATLREFVDRAGANGDECPVVSGPQLDCALWEQLVTTLDEHVASAGDAVSGEASVRLAAQLTRAVDEAVLERTEAALKRVLKVVKGARVAERQAINAAATRCLAIEPLRRLAIEVLVLTGVSQDGAAITAVLRAMLAAGTRPLNADFSRLATLARAHEDLAAHEALDALLLSALTAGRVSAQRATLLLTALAESDLEGTAARLRAAIEAHPKLAPPLESAAIAIEQRASGKRYRGPARSSR